MSLHAAAPDTRTARKAETRAALRSAARGCFAEHGFVETTIAHITRAAGVAAGTFYVHFPDKEAILDELLREFNSALVERLASRLRLGPPGLEEMVHAAADVFLTHWEENREFVRAYAQKAAAGMAVESLRDGINPQMTAFLLERLGAAFADGKKVDARLELAAQGILAFWLRIGMQYLFNPTPDRRAAIDVLAAGTVGTLEKLIGDRHDNN